MRDLYIKLLWYLEGKAKIEGLNLYKGGTYADIEIVYEGKKVKITLKDCEGDE